MLGEVVMMEPGFPGDGLGWEMGMNSLPFPAFPFPAKLALSQPRSFLTSPIHG